MAYHASKSQESGLNLCHVSILKQIIGFKSIVRLESVGGDRFNEVGKVL